MNAKQRLTQKLKEAQAPAIMIERASCGYYGDFTSPLATPIMQLVADCQKAGLEDIAKQAMKGDYDGK